MNFLNPSSYYSDFLMGLPSFGKDMGLSGILGLLNELGNFHKTLKIIHIAGTNGKGSSAAMLSSIYTQANFRVGMFTSPYFFDIRECISINNSMISIEAMNTATSQVQLAYKKLIAKNSPSPTHYECITVVALLSMYLADLDLCIIETLMGGRNDATNVFEAPLVSLITSISYDHMEYLGNTLSSIASHKAGIIKPNCPVILNRNPSDVLAIMSIYADRMKSPLIYSWDYRTPESENYLSYLSLLGEHQYENLLGVLCVINHLSSLFYVSTNALCSGLSTVNHPCRIERLTYKGKPFVLDGSHNTDGVMALVNYVKKYHPNTTITVILGILQDKEIEKIVSLIYPISTLVILVTPESPRALLAEALYASLSSEYKYKSLVASSMKDALTKALQMNSAESISSIKSPSSNSKLYETKRKQEQSLILACGSFSVSFPLRQLLLTPFDPDSTLFND
jgi:dihydrofolate synthase / folylpolyglutamate synthase